MRFLVGVGDIDSNEGKGANEMAGRLGEELSAAGLAVVDGITCHRFLVNDEAPGDPCNSAACLSLRLTRGGPTHLVVFCREFVRSRAAKGSNAGFCVAPLRSIDEGVLEFGRRAKTEVVDKAAVHEATLENNIYIEEVSGDGRGTVGALAAVALRAGGNDGRFLWLPSLDMLKGIRSPGELRTCIADAQIRALDGAVLSDDAKVDLGPRPRPVVRDGKPVFLVEKADDGPTEWRIASEEIAV